MNDKHAESYIRIVSNFFKFLYRFIRTDKQTFVQNLFQTVFFKQYEPVFIRISALSRISAPLE